MAQRRGLGIRTARAGFVTLILSFAVAVLAARFYVVCELLTFVGLSALLVSCGVTVLVFGLFLYAAARRMHGYFRVFLPVHAVSSNTPTEQVGEELNAALSRGLTGNQSSDPRTL